MYKSIIKRTVAVCLILVMTVSMAACGTEKRKGKPSMIRTVESEKLEE